jgi:ferredoxin
MLAAGRASIDKAAFMPRIEFLKSNAGPAVSFDMPKGGELRDACDDANAPVPFSCRSTSCGTCRIDVLEGGELLDPVGEDERGVLEIFGDPPGKRRLACTARVVPGVGVVKVRSCEDW